MDIWISGMKHLYLNGRSLGRKKCLCGKEVESQMYLVVLCWESQDFSVFVERSMF